MNKKLKFIFIFLICCSYLFISCSTKSLIQIEIKDNSVFINQTKIDKNAGLITFKKILGELSRIKIATQEEINTTFKKYGISTGNSYIYDDLGIILIEDPESKKIKNIEIIFIQNNMDSSSLNYFNGKLFINGKEINKNSSLQYLKTIDNLSLDESLFAGQPAKIYGYELFFHYLGTTTKTELESFSISMLSEIVDSKGWSLEDFNITKTTLVNNPNAQKMTKENNLNLDKLGDCYSKKLMQTFYKNRLQNPSQSTLDSIQIIINDCILEISKN